MAFPIIIELALSVRLTYFIALIISLTVFFVIYILINAGLFSYLAFLPRSSSIKLRVSVC